MCWISPWSGACSGASLPLVITYLGGESMARKRTTHRSVSGKKLYAVRDAKGRFVDIQTYERAHRADLRKKAKKEKKKK